MAEFSFAGWDELNEESEEQATQTLKVEAFKVESKKKLARELSALFSIDISDDADLANARTRLRDGKEKPDGFSLNPLAQILGEAMHAGMRAPGIPEVAIKQISGTLGETIGYGDMPPVELTNPSRKATEEALRRGEQSDMFDPLRGPSDTVYDPWEGPATRAESALGAAFAIPMEVTGQALGGAIAESGKAGMAFDEGRYKDAAMGIFSPYVGAAYGAASGLDRGLRAAFAGAVGTFDPSQAGQAAEELDRALGGPAASRGEEIGSPEMLDLDPETTALIDPLLGMAGLGLAAAHKRWDSPLQKRAREAKAIKEFMAEEAKVAEMERKALAAERVARAAAMPARATPPVEPLGFVDGDPASAAYQERVTARRASERDSRAAGALAKAEAMPDDVPVPSRPYSPLVDEIPKAAEDFLATQNYEASARGERRTEFRRIRDEQAVASRSAIEQAAINRDPLGIAGERPRPSPALDFGEPPVAALPDRPSEVALPPLEQQAADIAATKLAAREAQTAPHKEFNRGRKIQSVHDVLVQEGVPLEMVKKFGPEEWKMVEERAKLKTPLKEEAKAEIVKRLQESDDIRASLSPASEGTLGAYEKARATHFERAERDRAYAEAVDFPEDFGASESSLKRALSSFEESKAKFESAPTAPPVGPGSTTLGGILGGLGEGFGKKAKPHNFAPSIEMARAAGATTVAEAYAVLRKKGFSEAAARHISTQGDFGSAKPIKAGRYSPELEAAFEKVEQDHWLARIANLSRATKAGWELSLVARQGAGLVALDPKSAPMAFRALKESFLTEENFRRIASDIVTDRYAQQHAAHGGKFTEFSQSKKTRLAMQEESLMGASDLDSVLRSAKKANIPILGELGELAAREYRATGRANSAFINKYRLEAYRNGAQALEAQGKTPASHPQAYRDLSNVVNTASGVGTIPKSLQRYGPLLNGIAFSPQFVSSRLQPFNPWFWRKMDPTVRGMALKAGGRFMGFAVSAATLAKMMGADVEMDPNSPDWLKAKFGQTRIDFLAGHQQTARFLWRMLPYVGGQTKTAQGGTVEESRWEIAKKFGRGKMSPLAGVGYDLLAGETMTGGEVTPGGIAADLFAPLIAEDTYDAGKKYGLGAAAGAAAGIGIGLGISTYGEPIPEDMMIKNEAQNHIFAAGFNFARSQRSGSKEEKDKRKLKQQILAEARAGKDVSKRISAAVDDGLLPATEANSLTNSVGMDYWTMRFKAIDKIEDAEKAINLPGADKARWMPILEERRDNKRADDLSAKKALHDKGYGPRPTGKEVVELREIRRRQRIRRRESRRDEDD